MIEKKKYLFWLNVDDPNFDQEVVYREMYSRIGWIIHTLQMNEYNIANILALEEFEKATGRVYTEDDLVKISGDIDKKFDELSKLTFGGLKKQVKKSKYLADVNMALLEKIVNYRNYIAHRCFKEKLLKHELSTIEEVDRFVDELNEFEVITRDFNEWLLEVFKKNKIKSILLKL